MLARGLVVAAFCSLLSGNRVAAQSPQQQYVYASIPLAGGIRSSDVAALSKAGNGALQSLPDSPFPDTLEGGAVLVDPQGRFLFVANPASRAVSMFAIDANTGRLSEVSGSPFPVFGPAGPVSNPRFFLASDASGQYLYVAADYGLSQGTAALNGFRIQVTGASPQLLPLASPFPLDLPSAPIGLLRHPSLEYLYVGLGPRPVTGSPSPGTFVYAIDLDTGQLTRTGIAGGINPSARVIAMDPQGRYFFDGWVSGNGFLESAPISPFDGTAASVSSPVTLGSGNLPLGLPVDGSGKFLFASVPKLGGTLVFPIAQDTGTLGSPLGPHPTLNFSTGTAVADPQGPYVYSLQSDGIHAFLIDLSSGALSEIPGSPFLAAPQGAAGIAITGAGGSVQGVGTPAAAFSPGSVAFGTETVGETSLPSTVHFVNIGSEPLALTSVALGGSNPGDFRFSSGCPALLAPQHSCAITVTFAPTTSGSRQASLLSVDNAPGSPHSIPISGQGVPAEPSVTLTPGSLTFPSVQQSSSSSAQIVTLTNSGAAVLHVSSVLLSGADPNDFAVTSACIAPVAPNTSCILSITFSPAPTASAPPPSSSTTTLRYRRSPFNSAAPALARPLRPLPSHPSVRLRFLSPALPKAPRAPHKPSP